MKLIAHISDPHLGEPLGRFAFLRRFAGLHDTTHAEALRDAVKAIKAHPRAGEILTVITGDLTDRTRKEELQEAEEILKDLEADIVPGNHDATSSKRMGNGFHAGNFRAMLETVGRITGRGKFPYARDFGTWRLLCIDSSAHNERGTLFARGRIGNRQISWLAAQVMDQRPTVVALHHYAAPVSPVLAIEDADDLLAVLNRDHVFIINGHRHRSGIYPANDYRPQIIASGQTVADRKIRIIDPVSREVELLEF